MLIEQRWAQVKQRPYTAGDIKTCQRFFRLSSLTWRVCNSVRMNVSDAVHGGRAVKQVMGPCRGRQEQALNVAINSRSKSRYSAYVVASFMITENKALAWQRFRNVNTNARSEQLVVRTQCSTSLAKHILKAINVFLICSIKI